jgi:hypothetical protein
LLLYENGLAVPKGLLLGMKAPTFEGETSPNLKLFYRCDLLIWVEPSTIAFLINDLSLAYCTIIPNLAPVKLTDLCKDEGDRGELI